MNTRGILIYCTVIAAITSLHDRRNERGATTVEYGLIIGVCVLAFVGGVEALKFALGGIFGATQSSMDNSVP